jgi:NTE family protein
MNELELIKKKFPLFTSKALIDLVSGIDVSKDIIRYRKKPGVFGRIIDKLAGDNKERQDLLNGNLVEGQTALYKWVLELAQDNTISHVALQITQQKLVETRDVIIKDKMKSQELSQKIDDLTKIVLRTLPAYIQFNDIIDKWQLRNIYNSIPWAIHVALLAQEVFSLCTTYQMQHDEWKGYADRLITQILLRSEHFPKHFFAFSKLLELSLEDMKNSNDLAYAACLLEINPLIETRFANKPYLFVIGKTLQFATLQHEQVNPAQEALNICRNFAFIPSAINKEEFVEAVVKETLDECLVIVKKEQANLAIPLSGNDIPNSSVNIISPAPEIHLQMPVTYSSQALELIDVEVTNPKFGLVLAGGGAKGAYQVGVLKYLSEELQFVPDMIAGTSIGALNGSFLASHQPFDEAVKRLELLWDEIGKEGILKTKIELSKGLSIFDSQPIKELLKAQVKVDALKRGIELWVTVFPSLNPPIPFLDYLRALIDSLSKDGRTSAQWRSARDLDDEDTLYNSILASAAIPLVFPRQKINGDFFVDGFLGDNIPLGALAAQGCTYAIVIHLDNGETWSRHNFPNQKIIEIRPQLKINEKSFLSGLDFSAENITKLKQRGEEDARRYLEPIILTLMTEYRRRNALDSLIESTRELIL